MVAKPAKKSTANKTAAKPKSTPLKFGSPAWQKKFGTGKKK